MRTRLTLRPHQDGAKHRRAQSGDRLICVRYRYGDQRKKRFKTIQLIGEECNWESPERRWAEDGLVPLRIALTEVERRRCVKNAGGR